MGGAGKVVEDDKPSEVRKVWVEATVAMSGGQIAMTMGERDINWK